MLRILLHYFHNFNTCYVFLIHYFHIFFYMLRISNTLFAPISTSVSYIGLWPQSTKEEPIVIVIDIVIDILWADNWLLKRSARCIIG